MTDTSDLESTLEGLETDLGRAQAVAQLAVKGIPLDKDRYQLALATLEEGKQYHSAALLYLAHLAEDKEARERFRKEIDDWDEQDQEVDKKLKDILPGLSLESRAYVIQSAALQGSKEKRIGQETVLSTEERYRPEDGINMALLYDTAQFLRGQGLYEEATDLQLSFDPDGAVEELVQAVKMYHGQGDHTKAVRLTHLLVDIPRDHYALDGAFTTEEEWEQGIHCAEEIGDFESAFKFAVDCYGDDTSLALAYRSIMGWSRK